MSLVRVATGLLWPPVSRRGLEHLPRDIHIRSPRGAFYFPITTGIAISVPFSLCCRSPPVAVDPGWPLSRELHLREIVDTRVPGTRVTINEPRLIDPRSARADLRP
ncbi:MAG: DUF2905 domain-containing protein [Alphaproteobacteria bacterium]|nr:DUF2905 domain-containing protein [Alphaproteobacteria bacterium]